MLHGTRIQEHAWLIDEARPLTGFRNAQPASSQDMQAASLFRFMIARDAAKVPLDSVRELAPTAELLFTEAFGEQLGRPAAVDRLAEYFLVLLLRSAVDRHLVNSGVLNGLGDARLSKAISAMHERPDHTWTLEELARLVIYL